MSRSYKKIPIVKDTGVGSRKVHAKTFANRKIRRMKDISMNNSVYKKYYPQYDIHDYISYWPLDDALEHYRRNPEEWAYHRHIKSEKEFIAYWKKSMLGK